MADAEGAQLYAQVVVAASRRLGRLLKLSTGHAFFADAGAPGAYGRGNERPRERRRCENQTREAHDRVTSQDRGDPAEHKCHDYDEGAGLAAPSQVEGGAVFKPLLPNAVFGFALCERQDSISESGVDVLVFAEVLWRWVGRLAEGDALVNDFAGDLVRDGTCGRFLDDFGLDNRRLISTAGRLGVPR